MKKVSILMPVYNCEDYICDAIESILSQSYKNWNLIILDDGSTDNTVKLINSYKDKRIRLYKNEVNMGLPYTRNKLLELSDGEYIAIMDADDISCKNRLKIQVEYLENNKKINIVASNIIIFGRFIPIFKRFNLTTKEIRLYLMFKNCICNSSAMIRRDFIINNLINYQPEFIVAQDYAFWIDCLEYTDFKIINKYLIKYRVGHENITKKSQSSYSKTRKELLDKIHRKALENNGFYLSESELELYNRILYDKSINDKNELNRFFEILIKINNKLSNNKSNSKTLDKVLKYIWIELILDSSETCYEKIKLIFKKELNIKILEKFMIIGKIYLKNLRSNLIK